jgi:translocation and assembly module TamB
MALVLDIPALDSFARLFPEGYSPRGLLRGEALVGGSLDSPAVQVALEAGDLILPDRLKAAPPGPFTVSMKGSWAGSDVLLDTFRVDSEDLTVEAAGNWRGAPAPGALLRGEGARLAGDVVLEAGLDAPDLAWIAGAVAGFRQAGGSVTGSLKASGPVTDPDVSASLEIKGGEVSFTGVPLLSSLDGSLVFAGKKLTLHDVAGELGGSPMQLEGSVSFGDDWEPAFDLHIAGERLLLYRDQGVRVRADTEMSFTGPLAELAIAGTVSVVDSFFSRNIDLLGSIGGQKRPPVSGKGMLFSFRDPPLRDLRFNVALKAVDPFLIRNQFLRASVRPDLVLKGTGVSPVLAGRVFIDPSRLFLPAGTLRTEKGAISFREQAPDRPWIDLEGTTRLMGYDISMNITGFADDPRITLSSLPPLPNDELLLLVLLGTPPASGETEVAGSAGTALAVFLGRGFLNRFFGSGAETEEMILDRFETTIGRDITDTGEPTVESTFRLGEGFLWEGDTLFLTGEKDRYDEVNYGVRLTVEFRDKEKGDE